MFTDYFGIATGIQPETIAFGDSAKQSASFYKACCKGCFALRTCKCKNQIRFPWGSLPTCKLCKKNLTPVCTECQGQSEAGVCRPCETLQASLQMVLHDCRDHFPADAKKTRCCSIRFLGHSVSVKLFLVQLEGKIRGARGTVEAC